METGTLIVIGIIVALCFVFGGGNIFKDNGGQSGKGGSGSSNSSNGSGE